MRELLLEEARTYLAKAAESLTSAEVDCAAARYNSCANRVYYACFQAAIAALSLRRVLRDTMEVREKADYTLSSVSERVARRVFKQAQEFVQAIQEKVS